MLEFDRDCLFVFNLSVMVLLTNLVFISSVFVYFCCCAIEVVRLPEANGMPHGELLFAGQKIQNSDILQLALV